MPLRDHPPRGPSALLFRLPITLYRLKLGWLLGSRFLLLRHRGRRSGITRSTVLEVIHRDRGTGAYYVAAAWGERAQWYRNVLVDSRVAVTVGRSTFDGIATALAAGESTRVLDEYRRKHGMAMTGLQRLFGYRTFDELTASTPVVKIGPGAERRSSDAARS
jgi:deazaflavin-dependent oxidoreductase (nitroreductase family)